MYACRLWSRTRHSCKPLAPPVLSFKSSVFMPTEGIIRDVPWSALLSFARATYPHVPLTTLYQHESSVKLATKVFHRDACPYFFGVQVFGSVVGGLETLRQVEEIDTDSTDRPLTEVRILDVSCCLLRSA
jgi:hypothetical protein